MDGGIRNGTDLIKAKALGAKTAFVGRPYIYGLSAMGYKGVIKMINIIEKEMDITLALCGETNVNNLSKKNTVGKSE